MSAVRNFAITGVAGFVAPRHLKAIHDTGNRLVAAVDPHDAVGRLDQFSFDVAFFREFERFDRHIEKLRRGSNEQRVDFVTICSPNYLHDAHIRLALRVGAHAICEKPLVINPWNLDALEALEQETGSSISTLLQLRVHPALVELRAKLLGQTRRHVVRLDYVTPRGRWYGVSWKGSEEQSGGLLSNIGIHLFDLLTWLFGDVQRFQVMRRNHSRCAGTLELERADVEWFLSVDPEDSAARGAGRAAFRSLVVDETPVEFSDGFTDLHTRSYEKILSGNGPGIREARPSIELVYRLRHAPVLYGETSSVLA